MQKNYLKNLSKIHDEGFSEHSVKSFPFILKTINRFHKKGLIVELGCGSGITADKLIKNNYSVIGVDYSASMIELAKKNVPKVKFIVGSFHEIEIPKCVAVLAIGEVFNYNFDEKTNYKSLKKVFQRIYNSLEKDGMFMIDFLEENQIKGNKTIKTFVEGKHWVVLTEKKENKSKKELERRIITFYKNKNGYKRNEEVHKIKLFRTVKIIRILQNIGFDTKFYRSYGNYKLRKNQTVIVSKKITTV